MIKSLFKELKNMRFMIGLSMKETRRILIVILFLLSCAYNLAFGQFYYNKEVVSGVWLYLKVDVGCNGRVDYQLCSSQELRGINVNYSGGGADIFPSETNYNCSGNQELAWTKTFTTAATGATVNITLQYKQFLSWHNAGIGLTYDHTGVTPEIDPNYTAVLVAPNTYEFIYTGTGDASTYDYKFGFGDGDVYEGNGLNTTSNNEIAGGTSMSPHFYCRSDYTNLSIPTTLIIYENHLISGQQRNQTAGGSDSNVMSQQNLTCPRSETVYVTLENLCPLFTGFSVNNVGPTEFNAEVTSSSSGNSTLDGMVNSVTVSGSGGLGTLGTISSPNQTAALTLPSGQYQNYLFTETIEIEPGCSCTEQVMYDTDNPCFNLSDITATQSFVNGQYVYTFSLSDYAGGSSNTYTIDNPVIIDFGDGTSGSFSPGAVISHAYPDDGTYTVTQTVSFNNGEDTCEQTLNFGAETYCCINFAPVPEGRYWLSAWVKEAHITQQKTYENTYIEFSFDNGSPVQLYPSGDIIEGWQRIVGEFTIPALATDMQIDLVNESSSIEAFFDDVRVHPFNASMKSYVYDPETLWLTAELDDNNYATFYEYDMEGQLIRIKKETARGIMTIQESRSSNPKSE